MIDTVIFLHDLSKPYFSQETGWFILGPLWIYNLDWNFSQNVPGVQSWNSIWLHKELQNLIGSTYFYELQVHDSCLFHDYVQRKTWKPNHRKGLKVLKADLKQSLGKGSRAGWSAQLCLCPPGRTAEDKHVKDKYWEYTHMVTSYLWLTAFRYISALKGSDDWPKGA